MESPPPFDLAQSTSSKRDVWTVSRLNQDVKHLLDRSFGLIWLQGEISNFSRPASGHYYFSMKDSLAQIRCAMFRNRNRYLDVLPENGMQVLVRGRLGLYEARGEYQFIVEHLEEVGTGALQRQFEERFVKLEAEGLFDEERKLPIVEIPKVLGVITSATGAALQDVLDVLGRRFPAAEVRVFPTAVQGADAAPQIVRQLERAGKEALCDTLLLVRGGGSIEDLWAFNEEAVVRAIAACDIPIISGVGHEIDFTLTDFVADLRAPTPSAAAELACPDSGELLGRFNYFQSALEQQVRSLLQQHTERLRHTTHRLSMQHPERQLQARYQRCDDLTQRLQRAVFARIASDRGYFEQLQRSLLAHSPAHRVAEKTAALRVNLKRLVAAQRQRIAVAQARLSEQMRGLHVASPLATLGRGYSIARHSDTGEIVTRIAQLSSGDQFVTRVSDGEIIGKVVETKTLKPDA